MNILKTTNCLMHQAYNSQEAIMNVKTAVNPLCMECLYYNTRSCPHMGATENRANEVDMLVKFPYI